MFRHITIFPWLFHLVYSLICEGVTRFVVNVLSAGPMPQHVAIIMDSNRRYARKHDISETEAHTDGYYRLTSVSFNTHSEFLSHIQRLTKSALLREWTFG